MLYYSGNLGGGNPIPMNNYDISKQFKGTIFTSGLIREGTQGKKTGLGVKQKHRTILKTLPKAQRTRGLSSYHKITVHSWQILNILQFQNLQLALTSKSQTNISISTKLKIKILTTSTFRILTKIQLHKLNHTSAANFKILTKPWARNPN